MATTYETDPERLARLRAELAPHWCDGAPGGPGPGRSPFVPDPTAPCTVCRPWQQEADHYRALEATAECATGDAAAAAEAALTREAVDRWLDLEDRLHEHRGVLHGPLRSLPDDARLRAAYADPVPDTADGRAVWAASWSRVGSRPSRVTFCSDCASHWSTLTPAAAARRANRSRV